MAVAPQWQFELGDDALRYPWWVPAHTIALVMIALFDASTVGLGVGAALGEASVGTIVFLAPFVVWFNYWLAASWFNHTELQVTATEVVVRHQPLPGWRERRFARPLRGLRVDERRSRGAWDHAVCAHGADGAEVTLVHGLNPRGRAEVVQRWLAERRVDEQMP
jgi:hypothetical protein